ncbi:MAG: isoprenyl transferase [Chlorobi bacterium]|nr:isoprenyl transferase [Chlorobiota bacterium]
MKRDLTQAELSAIEKCKSSGEIPAHIAVIMDGNGRWAKKRGLPRVAGHQRGVETVRSVVETCSNLGVKYLTLYTFSTENWRRPITEVSYLMKLIVKSLRSETDELDTNNIKIMSIGNHDNLPDEVRRELEYAQAKTQNNTRMVLNLAFNYSGRSEITEAVAQIAKDYKNGIIKEKINEKLISQYLYTKDIPDPDLLIRSGGEYRISNFLLWQIAYAEIYVTKLLWPDFGSEELVKAIYDFQKRERRFGLVSEQLQKNPKKTKNAKILSEQSI